MIDFLEVLAAQHKDDESIKAFNEIKNHLLDKNMDWYGKNILKKLMK